MRRKLKTTNLIKINYCHKTNINLSSNIEHPYYNIFC